MTAMNRQKERIKNKWNNKMGTFLNFVFGISLMVIWIVSGGFITQTNVFVTYFRRDNPEMGRAWTYSFAAAFITWFLVALFLILVGLAIFGVVALFGSGVGEAGIAAEGVLSTTGETAISKIGIPWVGVGFFVVSLILVAISGVLSALTAQNIHSSPTYKELSETNPRVKKAYVNSIIAACLCLGAFGVLLIGFAIYTFIGIRRRHKEKQKLEEEKRQAQQAEIEAQEKKKEAAEERSQIQNQIIQNVAAGARSGNLDAGKILNTIVSKSPGKIAPL